MFRRRQRKWERETAARLVSEEATADAEPIHEPFSAAHREAGNRATAQLLQTTSEVRAGSLDRPALGRKQAQIAVLDRALVGAGSGVGNAAVQRHVARIQRQVHVDPAELEKYRIRGGKYSAREKRHAVEDPAGLMLTAPVEGRLERRLAGREPGPLHVSKEMMRFEGGKLGDFVGAFNEFTDYLGEVLHAIGRLQDLLSAGAPETPLDMTAAQERALRPTDNTRETAEKKAAYREWRAQQADYATDAGGLRSGKVFEVTRARREFDRERQEYWHAHAELARSIEKYRSTDKPTYDALDLKLSDLAGLLGSGGVDQVLGARQRRKEYDTKMEEFEKALSTTAAEVRDNFQRLRSIQSGYWDRYLDLLSAMSVKDKSRVESRQRAALLGQHLAPAGEKRNRVLSGIRMPVYVADAWHALAVIGPVAREKMLKALSKRDVVDRAAFHHRRGNDTGFEDIYKIINALKQAESWEPVLTREEIEEWVGMDKLWDAVFMEFNK
jgi:hypothetical protein